LDRPSNPLRRDRDEATVDVVVDVLNLDVEEEEEAKFHAYFSSPLRDVNLVISVGLHMSKKTSTVVCF
jgi:hypothetical protein